MATSRRVRFEVLRRDRHTCRYCGASAPDAKLTVDHVIPVALGGGDEPSNLVTACFDCNSGKTSIAPDQALVEDVDATAMLFARAMERAHARRLAEMAELDQVIDKFDDLWEEFGDVPRDSDWRTSIERFLAAGLSWSMIDRNVERAMTAGNVRTSGVWRYFCGICWNEITDMTSDALRILEDGEV